MIGFIYILVYFSLNGSPSEHNFQDKIQNCDYFKWQGLMEDYKLLPNVPNTLDQPLEIVFWRLSGITAAESVFLHLRK